MDRILALIHRLALVPFPRPDDIKLVLAWCRGFLLDNGAYTYWKRGYTEYPRL